MEEQKTRGEPISDASITGIKTGLMGPLAGMGDSIIWAAVMPLLIAIFIPFAARQRLRRYRAADPLSGDHHGDKLRAGA
jgi:mannose/fructose/N-acetylgalactosamine-specific phosphotransferase system component IID